MSVGKRLFSIAIVAGIIMLTAACVPAGGIPLEQFTVGAVVGQGNQGMERVESADGQHEESSGIILTVLGLQGIGARKGEL